MKSTSNFDNSKPISATNSLFLSSGQRTQDDSSMDWSTDPAPASPPSYVPSVRECMSSSCAPLPNSESIGKRRVESDSSGPSVLNYNNNQLLIASSWDGAYHTLSVFGTGETSATDVANIALSITRMTDYFKHNLADKNLPAEEFADVVKTLWSLIASVYTYKWNLLPIEDKSIHKIMGEKILPRYLKLWLLKKKVVENSSSSSSSISLSLNAAVSSPFPTATSAAIPPLLTSVAPQKVLNLQI